MTRLAVLASLLLASAPPARGAEPTRAQTELLALGLKRQLNGLTDQLNERRERLVLETVGIASIANALSQQAPQNPDVPLFTTRGPAYVPGSPKAAATLADAMRPWLDHREEVAGLELKAALLAEELQRYKETGELSPTPAATAARFKLMFENPWTLPPSVPNVAALSMNLVELEKQLRQYGYVAHSHAPDERVPASRPAAQNFPAPEKAHAPAPEKRDVVRRFERDAGRGKPESNPVPGLIVLLSSEDPRGRALAADELGNSGAAAAPAVPALKRALSDPDRRVRASAALALGAVGNADAADDLRRALRDPDEEVRLSAKAALLRLKHP
jgi:hypothetical protein